MIRFKLTSKGKRHENPKASTYEKAHAETWEARLLIGESHQDAIDRAYRRGFVEGWEQSRLYPDTALETLLTK